MSTVKDLLKKQAQEEITRGLVIQQCYGCMYSDNSAAQIAEWGNAFAAHIDEYCNAHPIELYKIIIALNHILMEVCNRAGNATVEEPNPTKKAKERKQ